MAGWQFEICAICGQHGRPVTPDSKYGWELASKETATKWVDKMPGRVTEVDLEDMAHLLQLIHSSNLAHTESEVEPQVAHLVRAWNELNSRLDYTGDPAFIHETILLPQA